MEELPKMLERLQPQEWGWVKITFIALALMTFLGILLKRRTATHVSVELTAFAGLIVIFSHGVITRGVLGTAVSHPHGWIYFVVLIPHVLCGLAYAGMAIALFVLGWKILVRKKISYLPAHRLLGRIAAWSLYASVVLSLPL